MTDRTVLQERARATARKLVAEWGTINQTDMVVETMLRLGLQNTDEMWDIITEAVWTADIEFVDNAGRRVFVHHTTPPSVPACTDRRLGELYLAGDDDGFWALLGTLDATVQRWYHLLIRDRSRDEFPSCDLTFHLPEDGR